MQKYQLFVNLGKVGSNTKSLTSLLPTFAYVSDDHSAIWNRTTVETRQTSVDGKITCLHHNEFSAGIKYRNADGDYLLTNFQWLHQLVCTSASLLIQLNSMDHITTAEHFTVMVHWYCIIKNCTRSTPTSACI